MLRRARRSLPHRDEIYGPHIIAPDSSKPAVVGPFDAPARVRDCKSGAPGPLELGRRTDDRRFRFRFQHCPCHIVGLPAQSL